MPFADARILIAHGSQHGSTREVAEAIAEELRASGAAVDVRRVGDVDDLEGFSSIVFGAPLYAGRFPNDARRFLRRHRSALADLPVAVFALGPVKDTEEQWKGSREQLDRAMGKLEWLHPVAVALFGGAIRPDELRFPFNRMEVGDIRDWEKVRAWAADLAGPIRVA
jgi:menaquinone-dependent protoporphyrinogen oxidase